MNNPASEKGFSAIEILFFLVIIAIIAAMAVPRIMDSKRKTNEAQINQPPKQAADEASAVLMLRTIHHANLNYQLTAGGKFGTLPELGEATLLAEPFAKDGFTKGGYIFTESVTVAADGFCASAVPITGQIYRTFVTDQTGLVYASADGGINTPSCTNGGLTPNGAEPLQ